MGCKMWKYSGRQKLFTKLHRNKWGCVSAVALNPITCRQQQVTTRAQTEALLTVMTARLSFVFFNHFSFWTPAKGNSLTTRVTIINDHNTVYLHFGLQSSSAPQVSRCSWGHVHTKMGFFLKTNQFLKRSQESFGTDEVTSNNVSASRQSHWKQLQYLWQTLCGSVAPWKQRRTDDIELSKSVNSSRLHLQRAEFARWCNDIIVLKNKEKKD